MFQFSENFSKKKESATDYNKFAGYGQYLDVHCFDHRNFFTCHITIKIMNPDFVIRSSPEMLAHVLVYINNA